MVSPTLKSLSYSPSIIPGDISNTDVLRRYLREEFERVAAIITQLAAGHFDVSYAAPPKPRDGDVRLADGTTWNPGSGRGFYWYDAPGATWKFLG